MSPGTGLLPRVMPGSMALLQSWSGCRSMVPVSTESNKDRDAQSWFCLSLAAAQRIGLTPTNCSTQESRTLISPGQPNRVVVVTRSPDELALKV